MDQSDYREHLARDIARWRIDGIITADQERAMLAHAGAGTSGDVRALRMGWLISAVSVIGALVLGAGVVLFFASNWEAIPDFARLGVLVIGLLGVYAAGYVLMERLDMQRLGSALLLLGVVLFQAALFLVAQMYNMPVGSPILFLLGALGAFPVAYLFGSRVVLLLALAAITTWRIWAAEISYDDSAEEYATLVLAGALGVLMYAIGRLHITRGGVLARLGEVYLFAGALLTLGIIFCATFSDLWQEIIEYQNVDSYSAPTSVYVAIVIAMVAVAAQLVFRARSSLDLADVAAQAGVLVVALIVVTWPAWTGYAVLFNALFFALAAAIVAYGYLNADERYINAGLLAVGVGLLARYIDTFWSLLAGSAFFIAGGVLLLALAFVLERARRTIIGEMQSPDDGDTPLAQEALA